MSASESMVHYWVVYLTAALRLIARETIQRSHSNDLLYISQVPAKICVHPAYHRCLSALKLVEVHSIYLSPFCNTYLETENMLLDYLKENGIPISFSIIRKQLSEKPVLFLKSPGNKNELLRLCLFKNSG